MIKKKNYFIATICIGLLLVEGCKPALTQQVEVEATFATQAIVKVQPFDFDTANIHKVTGDYVHQSELSVPNNLVGQNKWIMFEGPVLENDLIAYRYYADGRHRYDIYGKKVSDLVMDTVSWNYHNIMDWGSDILKVGNSLGIGSPAFYYQDSLYTLSDWESKTIRVDKTKGDQSTIVTTFRGLKVGDKTLDVTEEWSLSKGNFWSEISLRASSALPEGMYFATGIVKHLDDLVLGETGSGTYAYTWGKQSFHEQEMGMAVSFSKGFQPKRIEDKLSHTFIFENAKQEVTYKFMAAWSEGIGGVNNVNSFENMVKSSQP